MSTKMPEKYFVMGQDKYEDDVGYSRDFDCYDKAVSWMLGKQSAHLTNKRICKVVAEEITTTTLKEYV